jgi:putative NADPH-quinone reductase
MRALVAVHSRTNHTLKVANRLREELGADLTIIEGEKRQGFFAAGFYALYRFRVAIKPCKTDVTNYDLLVLCCPTWTMSPPPAINSYMDELRGLQGKKLAVVVTMGGTGGNFVAGRIRNVLERKGMQYLGALIVRMVDVQRGAYFAPAERFAALLSRKQAGPSVLGDATQAIGNAAKDATRNVGRIARITGFIVRLIR